MIRTKVRLMSCVSRLIAKLVRKIALLMYYLNPVATLKFFLRLEDFSRGIVGMLGSRYYTIHPKHVFNKHHVRFFLESVKGCKSVLDCGVGSYNPYTKIIATAVDRVTGVDIDPKKIEIQKKCNSAPNVRYKVMDVTKELPDERYDAVILSHVLEHLYDPSDVLKRLHKITNKIIVKLPRYDRCWQKMMKKDLAMFYYDDRDHKREFDEEDIKQFLEENGWKIIYFEPNIDLRAICLSLYGEAVKKK